MSSSDEQAFTAWVAVALPALLRFGHQLTGDAHRGEELVQTALVKTWSAWGRIEAKDDPGAYVRRVMVNTHLTWWRRVRHEVLSSQPPEPPQRVGADALTQVDSRAVLLDALDHLGPRQRAVIVLRYFEDLSEAEIAAVLECSPGTVKSQASRAMASLRRLMSDDERATHADPERHGR